MEGRSPESLKPVQENMDRGFSEKRAARILEGKQTDNSQVKKVRQPVKKPTQVTRMARKIKLPILRKRTVVKKVISRRDKI